MSKKGKKKHIVRKILLTLIILLLLAGAGLYGWQALKTEYTVVYDSYTASTGTISNSLSFSGNLSAVNNEYYYSPAAATVRTIYVKTGDDVKEGAKLIRLSNGSTIEAGFDGRVNTIVYEEGEEVSMGTSLIQLVDFTHMKVSMRVDEYDIADVAIGDRCVVTVTSNGEKYESTISTIDYISASGGSVAYYTAVAYVDITGKSLPGMQVSITVPQEEATDVVVLKADAISFDETNQAYVWMKDEAGELSKQVIETGVSNGNYVEIKSGLKDGDEVFVETKKETTNAVQGLLSGLFGGNQFNGVTGGMGGFDPSSIGGGSFDPSSFGGGSFDPSSFGGFGGGSGSGSSGGRSGGNFGGGGSGSRGGNPGGGGSR